eukprot:TRINITY_DN12670_c0_g3_i1.p1 TRINITY_DN12670_c0_g3~~TRINITY_DN12670_c0_g3_i1.p1  ORF type:complete len:317 (-),score=92.58 TRINITY_DN12670_c0_g3_i1:41-991(-)
MDGDGWQTKRFSCVRIPLPNGRKLYLHYKKYTTGVKTTTTAKTLHEAFNSEPAPVKKGKIEVKKITNPLEVAPVAKKLDRDIALETRDVPEDRTILAVNFDAAFTEDQLCRWFGTVGKVRFALTGTQRVKAPSIGERTPNRIHIGLVVFKDARQMSRIFEPGNFQASIDRSFANLLAKRKEDREEFAVEMIGKYEEQPDAGTLEKLTEYRAKMEEDGFTLVVDNDGLLHFDQDTGSMLQKRRRDKIDDMFDHPKKKKDLIRTDFYKFQVKQKAFDEARKGDGVGLSVDEAKRRLRERFQEDRRRLAERRKASEEIN